MNCHLLVGPERPCLDECLLLSFKLLCLYSSLTLPLPKS